MDIAMYCGDRLSTEGAHHSLTIKEELMGNLLWILVAILIVAWLLGLGGIFHLAVAFIWIILVIAIVLAILALFTGGLLSR